MNAIINYLKTPLTWEFKKKKAFLKSDDKTILELKTGKKRASFEADDKTYRIINTGFWNPSTLIEEDKKTIAVLKRFFQGNTAWIEFSHGSKYLLRCKNPTFIRLSIYSTDHKEIVRYRLISKYKASLTYHVDNTKMPEADAILLLIAGCFIFRGIIEENKVTNLKSIVFSNAVPVKELPFTDTV